MRNAPALQSGVAWAHHTRGDSGLAAATPVGNLWQRRRRAQGSDDAERAV